ncbi:hypothetical protein Tco_0915056 [Tanacetum coccineum]
MDVEMAEPKTVEHGNKEKDVRTDAAKPDVEKNAKEKGDAENAENAAGFNSQVKESTEFPLPSSSLLVSSGFADVSPFMDIHIEQETPQIQSPLVQKVPVLVILENANLPPIHEILTKTRVSTAISPPHVTPTISTIPQQTTTPIPTSPIITKSLTITTAIPESNALNAVQLRSSKIQTPTINFEQESEKSASEILKIKREQADKQKMPKYTIKYTNKAALKEYDQKHDDDDDEDPPAGPNQGKAPSKESKTGKSVSTKEPIEEPIDEVVMDDSGEDVVHDDDQPQDTSEPKTEGDFVDLHLNDIEDMLVLAVQHKLFHLNAINTARSQLMVELMDKQMRERRIIRNLERLVGARELKMDYKLMMSPV